MRQPELANGHRLYTSGTLSQTVHQYYSSQWQLLEERIDSATTPDRQFVWGIRYIDDLVLRERDTDASGSVDERLYSLQDANWNVVAVSNTSGAVQERYSYTPYGQPIVLDGSHGNRSSSVYSWTNLWQGRPYSSISATYNFRRREVVRHSGVRCRWTR